MERSPQQTVYRAEATGLEFARRTDELVQEIYIGIWRAVPSCRDRATLRALKRENEHFKKCYPREGILVHAVLRLRARKDMSIREASALIRCPRESQRVVLFNRAGRVLCGP